MQFSLIIQFLIASLFAGNLLNAQSPVSWTCQAVKIQEDEFEIRLTATIKDGWHIYASRQGENFIGKATHVKFNPHPLIVMQGNVKEVGNIIKTKEELMGIETLEIRNKVEYIQKIKVKSATKTALSGQIEFQSCTDETCLTPTRFDFSIILNEH